MITTTVGQLLVAEQALTRLGTLTLPVKASYGLARMLTQVQRELTTFHTLREKAIRDLGETQQEAGKAPSITVKAEHRQAFADLCQQLADQDVELDLVPFDLARLGDKEVSAADLAALGSLVTFAEEA